MCIDKVIKIISKISLSERVFQLHENDRLCWLNDIEEKLGIKLPNSYKQYIEAIDFAPKKLDMINYVNTYKQKLDLIGINKNLRNEEVSYPPLPSFLVAISDGHDDNYICFDKRGADQEFKICNWSVHTLYYRDELQTKYPNSKMDQADYKLIAENFGVYIYDLMS